MPEYLYVRREYRVETEGQVPESTTVNVFPLDDDKLQHVEHQQYRVCVFHRMEDLTTITICGKCAVPTLPVQLLYETDGGSIPLVAGELAVLVDDDLWWQFHRAEGAKLIGPQTMQGPPKSKPRTATAVRKRPVAVEVRDDVSGEPDQPSGDPDTATG